MNEGEEEEEEGREGGVETEWDWAVDVRGFRELKI